MSARRFLPAVLVTVAVLTVGGLHSAESTPAALEARTSDAEGVRVVVQPRTDAPAEGVWEFDVTMDTHTKPLNDDLVRASVLIDDAGHHITPLVWEGGPPGGHHRKGLLRFPFEGAKPKSVELQIDGVGGAGKRAFRWQLD
jgi:hypothetical protein